MDDAGKLPADRGIGRELMNWPGEMREISCASSVDGTRQFSLFYAPDTKEPRPLVLSLHPWSGDYRDELDAPLAWACIEHGW